MAADGKQQQPGGAGSHPRNRWRCMQPRICPYCWKTFSNSFNLKQHTINVHIQSQGVTCDVCEKVVKNKWYLRKHLVTAHGAPLKRSNGPGGGGGKAAKASIIPKVNNNEEAIVEAVEDDIEDRHEEAVIEDNEDEEEINVDEVDPEGSKPPLAVGST